MVNRDAEWLGTMPHARREREQDATFTRIDPRPIAYRDVWTVCANCEHGQVHHGHLDDRRRWVDDGKCFVWVAAPRTAGGRKKGWDGCRCPGWAPGPLR